MYFPAPQESNSHTPDLRAYPLWHVEHAPVEALHVEQFAVLEPHVDVHEAQVFEVQ